jgi:hypothetical protein
MKVLLPDILKSIYFFYEGWWLLSAVLKTTCMAPPLGLTIVDFLRRWTEASLEENSF